MEGKGGKEGKGGVSSERSDTRGDPPSDEFCEDGTDINED